MLKKTFLIGLCGAMAVGGLFGAKTYSFDNHKEEEVKVSEFSEVESGEESNMLIDVPEISQLGVLPTGCESVSATMLLNFYGYDLSANEFVDKYLEKKEISEHPDPNSAFVGSPYDNNSYGCFAPCIAKAMNKVLKSGERAIAIKGEKLENIVEKYIKKGIPVLAWTTMDMRETKHRKSWIIGYVDENAEYKKGDTFSWPGNEHCVVLVGYNEEDYFVNDPLKPKDEVVSFYEKELFRKRYKEQGSQIVVIEKDKV